MVTTGDILTKYLNKLNITQTTIASILGVSPQYINALINNRKRPSKMVMNNLIKTLSISKEDVQIIEKYEVYKKVRYIEDYDLDIQNIDKEFILVSIDGSIDFVYVEHVNDKLYMRYLNHLKGTNILSRTNQNKIKIIGKYIGKYMGRILNG